MTIGAHDLDRHRAALTGHCYRMLGSATDADDAVQETMIRAWRSLDRFEGRSALRTWLHRIATNVCLDAIDARAGRVRPFDDGPAGTTEDELLTRPRTHWLEPIADAKLVDPSADPAEQLAQRQRARLALVAALQRLPARQRAALLLADVADCSAAEIAETLETSVASVNSALQRARATLEADRAATEAASRGPLTPDQAALVERWLEAFGRYDVPALRGMLADDVRMSMPPFTLWLEGPDTIARWFAGRGAGCAGSRVVAVEANGGPAFAQYKHGGEEPWALATLELRGEAIATLTFFLDVERIFPAFGLPPRWPG